VATDQMLEITGGNPKNELMVQLSDIGRIPFANRPAFYFALQLPGGARSYETATFIDGISAEDGSGECWNITGHVAHKSLEAYTLLLPFHSFKGFYNTRTRTGYLKPFQDN
jgi:hypothetical protein